MSIRWVVCLLLSIALILPSVLRSQSCRSKAHVSNSPLAVSGRFGEAETRLRRQLEQAGGVQSLQTWALETLQRPVDSKLLYDRWRPDRVGSVPLSDLPAVFKSWQPKRVEIDDRFGARFVQIFITYESRDYVNVYITKPSGQLPEVYEGIESFEWAAGVWSCWNHASR